MHFHQRSFVKQCMQLETFKLNQIKEFIHEVLQYITYIKYNDNDDFGFNDDDDDAN